MSIYRLIWDDFCSWLLRSLNGIWPIDQTTLNQLIDILDRLLVTLHPFIPFLTEELWQSLKTRDLKILYVLPICLRQYHLIKRL